MVSFRNAVYFHDNCLKSWAGWSLRVPLNSGCSVILFFASVEIILLAKKGAGEGMEGCWCRDGRILVQGWKDVGAGMEGRDGCPVPLQTQPASSHSGAEDILSTVPFQPTNHSPAKCTLFFFQRHGKRHRFTYTFVYVCIYFNCSAGHLMESEVLPCSPPPPAPSKRCAQCSTSLQLLWWKQHSIASKSIMGFQIFSRLGKCN